MLGKEFIEFDLYLSFLRNEVLSSFLTVIFISRDRQSQGEWGIGINREWA
jgi:hypothetical protein